MNDNPQMLRLGPLRPTWKEDEPDGECPECGAECAPECEIHPNGCIYGGPDGAEYWMIAEKCNLYHGE